MPCIPGEPHDTLFQQQILSARLKLSRNTMCICGLRFYSRAISLLVFLFFENSGSQTLCFSVDILYNKTLRFLLRAILLVPHGPAPSILTTRMSSSGDSTLGVAHAALKSRCAPALCFFFLKKYKKQMCIGNFHKLTPTPILLSCFSVRCLLFYVFLRPKPWIYDR